HVHPRVRARVRPGRADPGGDSLRARGGPARRLRGLGPGGSRKRRAVRLELQTAAEGVTAARLAALEPAREPTPAVGGRAVRPRLRVHLPPRLLLDAVVAA